MRQSPAIIASPAPAGLAIAPTDSDAARGAFADVELDRAGRILRAGRALRPLLTCTAFLACVALLTLILSGCANVSPESLYSRAIEDAKQADADEIMPLVSLIPADDMTTWNESNTKVLLLSWHDDPDIYRAGAIATCDDDGTWTFTDREIIAWHSEQAAAEGVAEGAVATEGAVAAEGVAEGAVAAEGATESVANAPTGTATANPNENRELRLRQLIGLPTDRPYTHVSAFWVNPSDVIRPAYQPDATKQMTEDALDGNLLGAHKPWFDDNAAYSYSGERPYPWTRLGYTYDWADNDVEYGLTEFLILANSTVEVEWTKTTGEFLDWLDQSSCSFPPANLKP